jgi:hypothetical protein
MSAITNSPGYVWPYKAYPSQPGETPAVTSTIQQGPSASHVHPIHTK